MAMESDLTKNPVSLKEFLEKVPPGTTSSITDLGGKKYTSGATEINNVAISLHCDGESCAGIRLFSIVSSPSLEAGSTRLFFLNYLCKNCSRSLKVFAVALTLSADRKSGTAYKYGEVPLFGPPTPARLITLFGPQRDLFLKGRRAENQGLGIAAFAYYRRVIEDQKNRIFDEIIKVCKRLSIDPPIIDELSAAKKESQFSKAVESVKHGIPHALMINGHNPLTLLHSALSEGLHAQTDEECLELATSIRVVMADFAERVGQALKEEAELTTAVSRLVSKKYPPQKP